MKTSDLRSVWQQASARDEHKKTLSPEEIKKLVGKQTRSIVDKIDLNVRISFGILLLLIVLMVANNYYFAPRFEQLPGKLNELSKQIEFPGWLYVFDIFDMVLAIGVFIYFYFCYRKINTRNINQHNLKDSLSRIVKTLRMFRNLFYAALGIIILNIAISFTSGIVAALNLYAEQGVKYTLSMKLTIIFVCFVILLVILLAFYYLWNYIFKKLYGRYLVKLKLTLNELENIAA